MNDGNAPESEHPKPDVTAFVDKLKKHKVKRYASKESELEDGVTKHVIPETERRRGFSYWERNFDETAIIPRFSETVRDIVKNESNAMLPGVVGVIDDGVIKWSTDAPFHACMLPEGSDLADVQFQIVNFPDGKLKVDVNGEPTSEDFMAKAGRFLKLNLSSYPNASLKLETWDRVSEKDFDVIEEYGKKLFMGKIEDYK